MKEFKKLAIASAVGALLMGAATAQAHVVYNLNSSLANNNATGPWTAGAGVTPTTGKPTGYTGNLPVSWQALIHNDTNPNATVSASTADALAEGATPTTYAVETLGNKWNPTQSWGNALDFAIVELHAPGNLTVTVAADAVQNSTFRPGFTLFSGWDTATASNKHGAWNTVLPTVPVNPRGSAGLVYLGEASTTVIGGTATQTFTNLPAGKYSLWIGGNGTGNGTGSQTYVATLTASAATAVKEDSDGDGLSDFFWRNSVNGSNALMRVNSFNTPTVGFPEIIADLSTITPGYEVVGRGDYNGDGKADVLWSNTAGDVYAQRSTATTQASAETPALIPATCTAGKAVVGNGDFNADGKTDVLLFNVATGEASVFLMGGAASPCLSNFAALGAGAVVKGTGDYNGDGKADILFSLSGITSIQHTAGTLAPVTIPAGFDVKGSGKFTADAKDDILLQDTGASQTLSLLDSATQNVSVLLGGIPSGWEIKGTGHYNKDGIDDILFRNGVTGGNYLLLMKEGSPLTHNFLPGFNYIDPALNYAIAYTKTQK